MLKNQSDIHSLSTSRLVFILFAGTLIRFLFGYLLKPWLEAPDQLAWGLSIDEMVASGNFNYTQLMHNAFESGSWVPGLLSIPFRSIANILPALSWSALLIDLLSRTIQIKIVQNVLGNKSAIWFGWWTIFSIPLILPWSTVNCGLHSLSAFFPFLFLFIITKIHGKKLAPIYLGLFCGLSMSFSFDNLVLAPVAMLVILWSEKTTMNKIAALFSFLLIFFIAFLPFLLARKFLNTGFQLESESVLSLRGVEFGNPFTLKHFGKFIAVWITTLPLSLLMPGLSLLFTAIIGVILITLIAFGLKSFYKEKGLSSVIKICSAGLVVTFFLFYAFSPFYSNYLPGRSYVSYRHLTYIVPFLIAIMIYGISISGKTGKMIFASWMILCIAGTFIFTIQQPLYKQPLYKPAGWILAKKFGHDVDHMLPINSMAEEKYRKDILFGYGWGLSATLFEHTGDSSSINKLIHLVEKFPDEKIDQVKAGVRFSFDSSVTPVLDKNVLFELEKKGF